MPRPRIYREVLPPALKGDHGPSCTGSVRVGQLRVDPMRHPPLLLVTQQESGAPVPANQLAARTTAGRVAPQTTECAAPRAPPQPNADRSGSFKHRLRK